MSNFPFHALPLLVITASISLTLSACKKAVPGSTALGCVKDCFVGPSNSSPALIHVDGLGISETEIRETLKTYPASFKAQFHTPEGRQAFLDHLIRQKLLVRLAQQEGLDKEPGYQYQVQKIAEGVLLNAYRQRLAQDIPGLKGARKTPGSQWSSHIESSQIIVKKLDDAKKAQALLKSGTPFATVAKKMSIDKATAQHGGRLRGEANVRLKHDPLVVRELQNLKDGQTSGILKVPQGYGIFRREGLIKAAVISPEDMLKNSLLAQYEQQQVDKAKSSMKIEVDDAALEGLLTNYR